ncbi:MAG: GTPase HflX [Oscillospiraceae bacterium]
MSEDEKLIAFSEDETPEPQPQAPAPDAPQKALLLGVDLGRYDAERSMAELAALAEADGLEPVAEVLQKRTAPDPATVLGAGRLAEAQLLAHNLGAQVAVFDGELSGSQLRNLESRLKIAVLDRTMLILQIFRSRATSREGKVQTELATLEYRLPRLAGLGTALSRQGGGGGGGGGARRGGGETMLEYDRRYIRSRIAVLKKRLDALEKRRGETRRSRGKSGVPMVALVGYTNVGKSSLVNALTGSDIGAADMLFATLDPTARRLVLPDGLVCVLVDTVGFVSRLPHNLVEAFKSTLEEAKYADLLLLVCDAADPDSQDQLAVTNAVLDELGIGGATPRLVVYNKCDKVPGFVPFAADALAVSAHTGQGLPALQQAISAALGGRMCPVQVLLPYSQLALADVLRSHGSVAREDFRETGVYYEGTVEVAKAHLFQPYLVHEAPDTP